jgi:Protein of Unknown function (DUF2784)
MIYRRLADLVLLAHAAFVLFVVFGGLVVLRRPRAAWAHLPAVAWGALVEFAGWICPLTLLENALRMRGGEVGYAGDFLGHVLSSLVYPAALTRGIQLGLGATVLLLNTAIYWRLLLRRRAAERP